ncbi:glutenin, high molecular weight subunit PW212-like, partial [Ixodes scapularis]
LLIVYLLPRMPTRRGQHGGYHPGGQLGSGTSPSGLEDSQAGWQAAGRPSPQSSRPAGGLSQWNARSSTSPNGSASRDGPGQSNSCGGRPWRRRPPLEAEAVLGETVTSSLRSLFPCSVFYSEQAEPITSRVRSASARNGASVTERRRPTQCGPLCHTVATWTTCDKREDRHFVSRQRWRDQPRPTPSRPLAQVAQPRGHTMPAFSFTEDQLNPRWLCQVPLVHQETHEASRRHIDILKTMGPLVCAVAAVQLLRRNRPDLLNPAAQGPAQTKTHPNEAPGKEMTTGESAPGPSTEHPLCLPVSAPRTDYNQTAFTSCQRHRNGKH